MSREGAYYRIIFQAFPVTTVEVMRTMDATDRLSLGYCLLGALLT